MLKKLLKNESRKTLVSNFIFLSILQVLNYMLPLVTIPYLLKTIGTEYFGLLAFVTSVIFYFQIFVDFGFKLTATRDIALFRENKLIVREIYSAVMQIKFLLMVIALGILIILIIAFEKFGQDARIYLLAFGVVIGEWLFPVWFFQGMERMKYITYLNILTKVIFTASIFVFVRSKSDYFLVPLLTSLGYITAGIVSIFVVRREFKIKFQIQSLNICKKYYIEGWNVFLVDFLPNMYNNFSTFFLGFFVNMNVVGYYSLAKRLIDVLNNFIYVIRNATYPYLNRNRNGFKKISNLTIYTGLIFTILVLIFSKLLLVPIFGNEASGSLIYMYILCLSPFFIAIAVSYGSNKLLVLKKDVLMRNITIIYSIFGFILALVAIPIYGAIGAAVTLIASRFIMAFLIFIKGNQYN